MSDEPKVSELHFLTATMALALMVDRLLVGKGGIEDLFSSLVGTGPQRTVKDILKALYDLAEMHDTWGELDQNGGREIMQRIGEEARRDLETRRAKKELQLQLPGFEHDEDY